MRALAEGELSIEDGVKDPMELCLLCRACESTCPSAVQYGTMMEITRHEIHRPRTSQPWPTILDEPCPDLAPLVVFRRDTDTLLHPLGSALPHARHWSHQTLANQTSATG